MRERFVGRAGRDVVAGARVDDREVMFVADDQLAGGHHSVRGTRTRSAKVGFQPAALDAADIDVADARIEADRCLPHAAQLAQLPNREAERDKIARPRDGLTPLPPAIAKVRSYTATISLNGIRSPLTSRTIVRNVGFTAPRSNAHT